MPHSDQGGTSHTHESALKAAARALLDECRGNTSLPLEIRRRLADLRDALDAEGESHDGE